MVLSRGTKRFLRDFGNGLKQDYNWKTGMVQKTGRRDINNLWSGYEVGGLGRTVGTAAALGAGGYYIHKEDLRNVEAKFAEQDIESLPGTRGDMTGYTANPGNFGGMQANGDLVFALHKLRHGG